MSVVRVTCDVCEKGFLFQNQLGNLVNSSSLVSRCGTAVSTYKKEEEEKLVPSFWSTIFFK